MNMYYFKDKKKGFLYELLFDCHDNPGCQSEVRGAERAFFLPESEQGSPGTQPSLSSPVLQFNLFTDSH